MRTRFVVLPLILAAPMWLAAHASDAVGALAAAREALGGDQKLAAVKAFSATGQISRAIGQFQTGEVELNCELPDKFVRKETLSIGPANTTTNNGFNGDGAIQESAMAPMAGGGGEGGMHVIIGPGGAGPNATPEQRAAARQTAMNAAKQDFGRLTVGLFSASFSGFPIEFTDGGTAESKDGRADVVNVKGPGTFQARLFIDGKTHMPLMLTWDGPAPRIVMARGPMENPETPTEPRIVEHRLFYADYRDVDGIKLPFRLARTIDGKPAEELTIEKFKLNPKLGAKTFQVSK